MSWAPQTRRLLTAVHQFVTDQARRHPIPMDLVRFTRRQLREHLAGGGSGWGDTQLKVHLARLVDLELVLVHRLETGAFGYELTWKRPAAQINATTTTTGNGTTYDTTGRFLTGLTDPATLLNNDEPDNEICDYDPEPVGAHPPLVAPWSGPSRPPVGEWSAPAVSVENDPDKGVDLLQHASGGGR